MASEKRQQQEIAVLFDRVSELKSRIADPKARKEAAQITKNLSVLLQDPGYVAMELAATPVVTVAARVALDLNLFEIVAERGGPVTAQELASLTGAEEALLVRLLRPLSVVGLMLEVGEQAWTASPITHAMARPEVAAGHRILADLIVEAAKAMPKYLREAGYKCPTDPQDGLIQYAFQTKMTYFDLMATKPELRRDFDIYMGHSLGSQNHWVDWFPVDEQILADYDGCSPLLVDVGGGKGHDLSAFHKKYPGQGTLVLQDLAEALENVGDLDPAIERMAYDFFTEQPVTGAWTYVLNHILHDWSDEMCLKILKQVRQGMRPGYSRLLIHEMIVPEKGAPSSYVFRDVIMLVINGGMERTERQFKDLLDKAGFQVAGLWPPTEEHSDGIIEAILKT